MKRYLLSSVLFVLVFCFAIFTVSCSEDKSPYTSSKGSHTTLSVKYSDTPSVTTSDATSSSVTTEAVLTSAVIYDDKYGSAIYPNGDDFIRFKESIPVNSNRDDSTYLFIEESEANEHYRFTDYDGYILYYFDLEGCAEPLISLTVCRNYKISVSWDDYNYTEVAVFDASGYNDNRKNEQGSYIFDNNEKTVTVNPYDYGFFNHIYILIEDNNKLDAYGAAVSDISFSYFKERKLLSKRDASLLNGEKTYSYYYDECATSKAGEDEKYIYFNTAGASDMNRFADKSRELIYKFSLSECISPKISLHIYQNYVISISPNGHSWTEIANFYDIRNQYPNAQYNDDGHLLDGSNKTVLDIYPADYNIKNIIYIKISNCNTSYGWGGSITRLAFSYYKETD